MQEQAHQCNQPKKRLRVFHWASRISQRLLQWVRDKETLIVTNETLMGLLHQSESINRALNIALGRSLQDREDLQDEALGLLAAITLQNNGEILLPRTFIDAANSGEMKLVFGNEDEGQVVTLRLKPIETEPEQDVVPLPPSPPQYPEDVVQVGHVTVTTKTAEGEQK